MAEIRRLGVLYCRQATTYQMYQDLVDDDGEERESDKGEVEEYSMLVGDRLGKRMLLYRPG